MVLYTTGGILRDASDASKKSVQNARMWMHTCFNEILTRKTLHRGHYEGSCKNRASNSSEKPARGGSSNEVHCAEDTNADCHLWNRGKSRDLSICVHHCTLRAPCPKGQGIRQLPGEVAATCSWRIVPIRWFWSFCVSCWELSSSGSTIILGIVLRTVLASEYNDPGDRRHSLSERMRKIHLDSCLKDSIVDDSLDYFEWRREEGLPKPIREQDLPRGRRSL